MVMKRSEEIARSSDELMVFAEGDVAPLSGSTGRGSLARALTALTVVFAVVLSARTAWAQIAPITPDASAPGAETFTRIQGWSMWYAYAAAGLAVMFGALTMAIGHVGTHGGALMASRKFFMGAAGASLAASLGVGLINALA
jgi:hypothetical protein